MVRMKMEGSTVKMRMPECYSDMDENECELSSSGAGAKPVIDAKTPIGANRLS